MDLISLLPLIFLLPALPYVNRYFKDIDVTKFAYGAVTTGILLTFYGVWVGLNAFDVMDIENSIPNLLAGLRTAFGSSLVGLGTSMIINLFFVDSRDETERSLDDLIAAVDKLSLSLKEFNEDSADANIKALMEAIDRLTNDLEMGINSETKEVMTRFRLSTETLYSWQQKYMEEIKNVTEAMDRNAEVTRATTEQLDRTNDVLDQLGPVTETIAQSIGWVRTALPSFRPRPGAAGTVAKEAMTKQRAKNGEDPV